MNKKNNELNEKKEYITIDKAIRTRTTWRAGNGKKGRLAKADQEKEPNRLYHVTKTK